MSFGGSTTVSPTYLPIIRGCTSIVLYPDFDPKMMADAIQNEKYVLLSICLPRGSNLNNNIIIG